MQSAILAVVGAQNSADNDERRAAERQWARVVAADYNAVAATLLECAMNEDAPTDLRQSCLLHLKRLVPQHWSMAFPSFTGSPIDQALKSTIRAQLVRLVAATGSSKVRKSASYVIAQIAVADFPDEWPDLLQELYGLTNDYTNENSMVGGLLVFNDLFDDLITEEQFWDGGIGEQLIRHIVGVLSRDVSATVKLSCVNLYQIVFKILQSPEAFESEHRRQGVYAHVQQSIVLLTQLLDKSIAATKSHSEIAVDEILYRSALYRLLHAIIGTFNKRIPHEMKCQICTTLLPDLTVSAEVHRQLATENVSISFKESEDIDTATAYDNLLSDLISTLQLLQNSFTISSVSGPSAFTQFSRDILTCAVYSNETVEAYEAEINDFITDTTGLSVRATPRDSVYDLLSELNSNDSNQLLQSLVQTVASGSNDWRLSEANLWLLEGLFTNEDSKLTVPFNLVDLLNTFTNLISLDRATTSHPLLTSRVFLLLPKFFDKFQQSISAATFGIKAYMEMISFAVDAPLSEENLLVKASAIISCTNYNSVLDVAEKINSSQKNQVQANIFALISSLIESSEEDALPVLLEALTASIDLDHAFASKFDLNGSETVIDMVLKVSFKDPANVQLIIDASECLKSLLRSISIEDYISSCERSLPFISNILSESFVDGTVEYSANLDLALDLLGIIVEATPTNSNQGELPVQIFEFIYPILKNILLKAVDDQILQSGGGVFNNLIQKAHSCFLDYIDPDTKETGMQSLLNIVSKFLSPQLSDRAAMNCGTIVSSLIDNFKAELGDNFLSRILAATTERLILAKEVITIENLIMLFCDLVLLSAENTIDFLVNNIRLKDPKTGEEKSGLELILPIWFQSFEVTRGFEKIKQNVLALAKIFSLGDLRVQNMIVNGDIIPYEGNRIITRSMTKAMPDRFTQISASLKIIKLLVGELEFQSQQPNASEFIPENDVVEGDDDDDGWEDLEDIGIPNYDKLRSYVESDDEDNRNDNNDGDLRIVIVEFFKECASKNLGNFQQYYEQLDDDEKRTITENVVF